MRWFLEQKNLALTVSEESEVSKIIGGQRNVSKDIIYLFQTVLGVTESENAIRKILNDISDSDYVKEQIYCILWNDSSISQTKKQELSTRYNHADAFLSDILLFVLSRNFIPSSLVLAVNPQGGNMAFPFEPLGRNSTCINTFSVDRAGAQKGAPVHFPFSATL